MNDEQNNPFAAPTAEVHDVSPSSGRGELAGRGARLGASMLDGVLAMALFFGVAFLMKVPMSAMEDTTGGAYLGMVAMMFLGFVAIQGYFLHTQGQTVGKKLMGLRIVRSDGSRATLGRLLFLRMGLMWVVSLIPVIGNLISFVDCALIFRDSRQCLHDQIADTIVVLA